ncbi:DUF433 domain-containing protein [Marinagarivorans algicola]|uniref:DUF433 domain-containing protein n=1 Tax=Marinagarivorans algicola TaxID=1513270 RepID=UPI0037366BDA
MIIRGSYIRGAKAKVGMTAEEIQDDFPEVKPEHIQACLSFAASREHHLHVVTAA